MSNADSFRVMRAIRKVAVSITNGQSGNHYMQTSGEILHI